VSMIRQIAVLMVAALCLCAASPPLTVQVQHHDGQHALNVSGTAPSGTPVTITVYAAFSRDLPVAFLNTWTTQTGSDGRYSIRAPIAGDFFKGTIITVRADSADGSSTTVQWIVDRPSSQWIPAADDVPGN
jgi:hypothetical protein